MGARVQITLTAYNMGAEATEADFDAWCTYVADAYSDAEDVEVDAFSFTGGPDRDRVVVRGKSGRVRLDETDDERDVRERLAALWDDWCTEGAPGSDDDGPAALEEAAKEVDVTALLAASGLVSTELATMVGDVTVRVTVREIVEFLEARARREGARTRAAAPAVKAVLLDAAAEIRAVYLDEDGPEELVP